jgi:transposase-like protein
MNQKRSYKQYPKEFKDEAVALVLEQGYSVPEGIALQVERASRAAHPGESAD